MDNLVAFVSGGLLVLVIGWCWWLMKRNKKAK